MRVALFTHRFLEPTHYAIGQTLDATTGVEFDIFSRWFGELSDGIGGKHVSTRRLLVNARFDSASLSDADLVHIIYDGDTTFDAISMAGDAQRPIVLSFHGGFDTNAKIFDDRYRARTIDACRRASVITVVGNTDVDRLNQLGISKGVSVLPVPIDTGLLPVSSNHDPWRITAVGRLVPKKGFDLALACLAQLPPRFSLAIVGDGELKASLMVLAKTLGIHDRVKWIGPKPLRQMLRILAESALLLHPARVCEDGNAEGTPQVILWAQALSVPVVATDTGSIADIVTNGRSGLLADPEPEALSAAVLRLCHDHGLRAFLVSGGRRNVRRHQLNAVADKLTELYRHAATSGMAIVTTQPLASEATRMALAAAAVHLDVDVSSLRLAGKGGHGHIYVVRDCRGQLVAVKIPAYDAHTEDRWSTLQHKLKREWTVLSEAAGDGLPARVGVDPEGRFLARHYVVGETLARAVRYASIPTRTKLAACSLELGRKLFRRFHHHSRGTFLLRDFKPQNIVIPVQSLQDFQFVDVGAVLNSSEVHARSWNQDRLGTGQWLHWAPEQLLGDWESIGVGVDFFALGVTAFYCLMGQYPYTNRCAGVDEVRDLYREEHAAAMTRLQTAVPPGSNTDITAIIAKCIDPDLHRRLASLESLDDLNLSTTVSATELFGVEPAAAQRCPL